MQFNALHCFAVLSIVVAGRTGFEPATSGVTGQCSNQLNYRPAVPKRGRDCLILPALQRGQAKKHAVMNRF